MRIAFDINDMTDISRASAMLAAIGLVLSGEPAAISVAPVVAQEATKGVKVVKAKKPDPVETYNAMAAAAGAPVVEVPSVAITPMSLRTKTNFPVAAAAGAPVVEVPSVAITPMSETDIAAEVAKVEQKFAPAVVEGLTFEQKCKAITDIVRKRSAEGIAMGATMASIGWTAQDGMLRAMSPEKVDTIHGKAVAL